MPRFEFPPFGKKKKSQEPTPTEQWVGSLRALMPEGLGPDTRNPADSSHAALDDESHGPFNNADSRAEAQILLGSAIGEYESSQDRAETGSEELVLTEEDTLENIRINERENKALAFAEKYKIADIRRELLYVEEEYYTALVEHKGTAFNSLLKNSKLNHAKALYESTKLDWRNALVEATASADPREKVMAKFIGMRDTTLRAKEVENDARLHALTSEGKTAVGKLKAFGKFVGGTLAKGYLGTTEAVGKTIASGHEYITGNQNFDKEKTQKNYTRAVRIVTGALLGTAGASLFGTIGAAGVSLTFLLKAARGTLGVAAGTSAGYLGGTLFKKTGGETRRKELLANLKQKNSEGHFTSQDQADEERLYARGTTLARQKAQQSVEFWSALIVGGSTSIASGVALHQLADTPALHSALDTIKAHQPTGGSTDLPSASESAAAPKPGLPPEVNVEVKSEPFLQEVTVSKGEGADQLLKDLQAKLNSLPEGSKMPPHLEAIQKILADNPHHLAQQLKLSHEAGGIMLQPGDTLDINDKGQLVFHEAIHGNRGTIILDAKGNINHTWLDRFKTHTLKQPDSHQPAHQETIRSAPAHEAAAKPFTTDLDQENVRAANQAELIHEQQRVSSVPIEASPTPAPTAPETASPVENSAVVPAPVPSALSVPESSAQPSSLPEHGYQTLPAETATLPASAIDPSIAKPYLDGNGHISMYGGTVDQQRDYATAYAQLHPGEPVRFTVVTRGFFGGIKHHVEEVTGAQDGTVRLLKVGPDGKPFTAINSSTFTSVLNK